jgi:hypothetical protein
MVLDDFDTKYVMDITFIHNFNFFFQFLKKIHTCQLQNIVKKMPLFTL